MFSMYSKLLDEINIVSNKTIMKPISTTITSQSNYTFGELVSSDTVQYDVSKEIGWISELPNLLNTFNQLKQIHNKTNATVVLNERASWRVLDDDNKELENWFIDVTALINLNYLINSDDKTFNFKKASLHVTKPSLLSPAFQVVLIFTISDITQYIPLFSYEDENIPVKQKNMKINVTLPYKIDDEEERK